MFVTIIVLAIIICVLLILVVLIQNPKGGGISSNFSSGNKIMGVKRTNDFIEKATWTLVISLFVLAMASNMFSSSEQSAESALKKQFEDNGVPQPSEVSIGALANPAKFGTAAFGTAVFGATLFPQQKSTLTGSGFTSNFKMSSTGTASPYTVSGFYVDFIPGGRI